MYDVVFDKAKGRATTLNRKSVCAEAAVQGFFKKDIIRNFEEFATKNLSGNFFFGVFLREYCIGKRNGKL